MANVVVTSTRPSDVRGCVIGNKRMSFRDITTDTGNYVTGGFTLTAAQLIGTGTKHIDACIVCSSATEGTSGANAAVIGATYTGSGTSVTFQVYESAGSALPLLEKDSGEAMLANFTFRVCVIHT